MIIHLNNEMKCTRRRQLLSDDVYVLFHNYLKELHEHGFTGLSQAETYLSALQFVSLLLSLPNVEEGLDEELEDLENEAEGENDAMIISMLATAIIYAVRERNPSFDYRSVICHIYEKWGDHPLYFSILNAGAQKEEKLWMEKRKIDLLTCELKDIELNNEDNQSVEELMNYCVSFCNNVDTIKELILALSKFNIEHGCKYTSYINSLYDKLSVNSRIQVNIDKINDIHDNEEVKIEK